MLCLLCGREDCNGSCGSSAVDSSPSGGFDSTKRALGETPGAEGLQGIADELRRMVESPRLQVAADTQSKTMTKAELESLAEELRRFPEELARDRAAADAAYEVEVQNLKAARARGLTLESFFEGFLRSRAAIVRGPTDDEKRRADEEWRDWKDRCDEEHDRERERHELKWRQGIDPDGKD